MFKKILIAEDHVIVQMGLEIVLTDSFPHYTYNFTSSFPAAMQYLSQDTIDLIILDVDIPGSENSKMIGKFRSIQPDVKILIFTGLEEEIYGPHYRQAGADGFLSKTKDGYALVDMVKKILYRNNASDEERENETFARDIFPELSVREQEIMHLLILGKYNKEIALHLNLEVSTVSSYKSRIFKKLNVTNVLELINTVQLYKNLN